MLHQRKLAQPRHKKPGCLVPVVNFDTDNIDTYVDRIQLNRGQMYGGTMVYVDDGFTVRDRVVNLSLSLTSETGFETSFTPEEFEPSFKSKVPLSIVFRDTNLDSDIWHAVVDGLQDLLLHQCVEMIVDYAQPHTMKSLVQCVENAILDRMNYRKRYWTYQSQVAPYQLIQKGQKPKNLLYCLNIHHYSANRLEALVDGVVVDKLEQLLHLPGKYKLLLFLNKVIAKDKICYCELRLRRMIVNTTKSTHQQVEINDTLKTAHSKALLSAADVSLETTKRQKK